MAVNKTISVTAAMASGFRIEGQLGNHLAVIDQPKASGGNDEGPTPLDYFLFSLGGCVASIGRIVAKQQKLELRGMKVKVTAGLNVNGLIGRPTEDRTGFQSFEVSAEIDADMTEAQKQEFLDTVCARCPVHDNIAKATVVEHTVAETADTL